MAFYDSLKKFSQDGHLPIGVLVFFVGCVMEWFHHMDPSFVAFTTTVLGFLAGHAWVKEPDIPRDEHHEDDHK